MKGFGGTGFYSDGVVEIRGKGLMLKRKIYVHYGMTKTGSGAIQEALQSGILGPEWTFVSLNKSGNQSGELSTLFLPSPEKYHSNVSRGYSLEKIRSIQECVRREYEKIFLNTRTPNLVLSAEDIFAWPNTSKNNLCGWLRSYDLEPIALGYIRPVDSWCISQYQQNLRHSSARIFDFDSYKSLPSVYANKVQGFKKAFGEENFLCFLFHPENLKGGDVVTDFLERIGAVGKACSRKANESLKWPALKILYIFSKFQQVPEVCSDALHRRFRLVDALQFIFRGYSSNYGFSKDLLKPVIDSYRPTFLDLNQCLRFDIGQRMERDGIEIASEKDLLHVTEEEQRTFMERAPFFTGGPVEVTGDPLIIAREVGRLFLHVNEASKGKGTA